MAGPLLAAALLPVILTLAQRDALGARVVLVAAWLVFLADLVVHVRLSPGYLRTRDGVFDAAVVVLTAPWFLLPGLGAARFTALVRLVRLLRVLRVGGGGLRRLAGQVGRVAVVTAGVIVACAYVAYSVEQPVNEGFRSFGQALWWATVTITTVGYGDVYPVTTSGRVAAVVLMVSGLGVLGVLAGSLASFFGFGEHPEPADGDAAPPATADLDPAAVRARLAEIEEAVAALRRRLG